MRRATYAVYVVFGFSGLTFASWASRIPQVRDGLQLTPSQLGLLLLSVSVGSVLGLPLAGLVVSALGTLRAVTVTSLTTVAGVAIVAVGVESGVVPVASGLVVLGVGFGTWDVAMNVEGAAVEQRLGRSIMSRFHAGFSIGTVAGALIGAAMISRHVSVRVHLLGIAMLVGLVVPLAARSFLPIGVQPPDSQRERRSPLKAWTEPRTLLVGLFVLTAAFSEGTGNDWLGVAAIDGYHASAAIGSLTFAVFLGAMTLGRWFGATVIDHYGRVTTLRASSLLAFIGLLFVVSGWSLALALAGVVAWGLGTALGFPTGMSAAADDPHQAAGRLSVVSSIGYTAFLAGPPVIGLLAENLGILHALSLASGLLAIGALVAGACRPLVVERAHETI